MKKKVLSVILAAVCTMGLMAGCGAEGSKGSTQSGSKGDSYTVGISQFAGSACSSNKPAISSTLKSIGLKPSLLDSTLSVQFAALDIPAYVV